MRYGMSDSANAWILEGFQSLKQDGPDSLRVDRLSHRLGLTKGSFYHHFRGREDYVAQLLQAWKRAQTTGFIEQVRNTDNVIDRIERLQSLVEQADHELEAAIRAWSVSDPAVRRAVGEVDNLRLDWLKRESADLLGHDAPLEALAHLNYTTLIGAQMMVPPLSAEQLAEMHTLIFKLVEARHEDDS